jgi:hypothetical protein
VIYLTSKGVKTAMDIRLKKIFIILILYPFGVSLASERLDCWADIMLSLGASKDAAQNITSTFGSEAFKLDYAEKQNGSFSVAYDCAANKGFTAIGFVSGQFAKPWSIDENSVLCLKTKIISANMPAEITVELVDDGGKVISISSPVKGEDWQQLRLPVKISDGFNTGAVVACRFPQPFIKDSKIWFDDVYFLNPVNGNIIGITDKPVEQRINESAATRQKRVEEALPRYRTSGLREGFQEILFKFISGVEIEQMNKKLCEILTTKDQSVRNKYRLNDHWCLVVNQTLYRLYYMYGSKGTVAPGRLSPEAEKALLAELWNRTLQKNDIAIARQSTWWLTGSENHDMVCKVSNLLASQIFKDLPEYKGRVLLDEGTGGGTGYWFDQMYGDDDWQGPKGRANLSDGKKYNSNDHYQAWVAFFEEYIKERLHKGFFLETFSSGYMGVTISHLYDVYDLCEDKELKELTGKFLDAIWADWAQDTISGVKGGAKTRASALRGVDAMGTFAQFEFGGKLAEVGGNMWVSLVTNYRFPDAVWDIALDREGLGSFEYISRRPGEEENIWPRPLGTERTLLCDTESRFCRYSWVTPDYILGCQMDHPAAVHSHLSVAVRWQGLTIASEDNARIFPCGIDVDKEGKWKIADNTYFRNFQKNNIMITQQARRWNQANPDWFPAIDMYSKDIGVYFGNNLDEVDDANGWIFTRKNNAFAAIRVILSDVDTGFKVGSNIKNKGCYTNLAGKCYEWNTERTIIKLADKYSPIIFHSARRQDYKSFDDFKKYIYANELNLIKTVVQGYFIVEYKPINIEGSKDVYYFNAANTEVPSFNGEYVNYSPQFLFKSPFMSSLYKSGQIDVSKGKTNLSINIAADSNKTDAIKDDFELRSRQVLESQLESPFPGPEVFTWHRQDFALAAMMLNEKLDEANKGIIEACDRILADPNCPCKCELHWNINLFFRIYELFGSQSKYYPARLSPAAEQKIVDVMWFWLESNSRVSDTNTAQSKSWYIWESENHDAMNKTSSWSAAMILSSLADYHGRLLKDGKTTAEHFTAWNEYFKFYLRERAIKGGLIETGSHTYTKYALQGWYNFYDFAQDSVLKTRAGNMLDLYWTCWALEQIDGINAGAKSRVYSNLIEPRKDCAYAMCWYYLGIGKAADKHPGVMCLATSSYRMPDIVRELATDTNGRGRYEFYTRKLGRNIGTVGKTEDGHLLYKLDSQKGGLVKYSYVTEDFVMGSFLQESFDEKHNFWAMISSQNRWIGVAFRGGEDAVIVPTASDAISGKATNNYNQHISVQKNGTMIVRKVFAGSTGTGEMKVYIGKDMKAKQLGDAVIIAETTGGYAAIKSAWGNLEKVNDNWYKLSDSNSPIIIEAACRSDYKSINVFAAKVIDAKPVINKKENFVKYKSIDGQNQLTFYTNSKLPEVNGTPLEIYPEFTYKSPYLNSKWDDGIIEITKGSKKKVLDFNRE